MSSQGNLNVVLGEDMGVGLTMMTGLSIKLPRSSKQVTHLGRHTITSNHITIDFSNGELNETTIMTGTFPPPLNHTILYGIDSFLVFTPSLLTIPWKTKFFVLPLSIISEHNLPLAVQVVH